MSSDKIIIKNAILTTLLIGLFFLLCKYFGLEDNPYLRFLNLGFVLLGINLAIRENISKNKESKYTNNFGVGIRTSAIAVVLSILGVLGYIKFIDSNFLEIMNSSFLIGGNLSLGEIIITLFIEGMASSFIGSFVMMQLYKNPEKMSTINI